MLTKRKCALALAILALINQAQRSAARQADSESSAPAKPQTLVRLAGQRVELECKIRPDELLGSSEQHLIDAELARSSQPDVGSRDDSVQLILWYHSQNSSSKLQRPIYSVDARGLGSHRPSAADHLDQDRLVPVGRGQLNYHRERHPQANHNNGSQQYALARMAHRLAFRADFDGRAYLRIEHLEPADAGQYRCRVDFERARTRYQTSQLDVISPLGQVQIKVTIAGADLRPPLEPLEVNEDELMQLECEASEDARLLWWRLDWPDGARGGVAAGARITRLSGADRRLSRLRVTAGDQPTERPPEPDETHLVAWMTDQLGARLSHELAETGSGSLARRLDEILDGSAGANREFWELLGARRMVAFVCGASNTFGRLKVTGPADKLAHQIRPVFRSILVGQANAKPRSIQIYLLGRQLGQQQPVNKLTRLHQGQSLHLNLQRPLNEPQLQLACEVVGAWPRATLDWQFEAPAGQVSGRPSSELLISDDRADTERLISAKLGQLDEPRSPVQWASVRLHNISVHEHGSIIKCLARNHFYLARALGKQRSSSIISTRDDERSPPATGKDSADAASTWVRLNITHAPVLRLGLPESLANDTDLLISRPSDLNQQICGPDHTSTDDEGTSERATSKCTDIKLAELIEPSQSFVLTCSIAFANPPPIENVEWSFKRLSNNQTVDSSDTWTPISRFASFGSASPDANHALGGHRADRQRLTVRLSAERFNVYDDFLFRCGARNQLGEANSNLVRIRLGPAPRCTASDPITTEQQPLQCPVISYDRNSSAYHYDHYYRLTYDKADKGEQDEFSHHLGSEIVIKCSVSDKFGSNVDRPCEMRLHSYSYRTDQEPVCWADLLSDDLTRQQNVTLAETSSKLIRIECLPDTQPANLAGNGSLASGDAEDRTASHLVHFDLYKKRDARYVRRLASRISANLLLLNLDEPHILRSPEEILDEHLIVVSAAQATLSSRANLTIHFKPSGRALPSVSGGGGSLLAQTDRRETRESGQPHTGHREDGPRWQVIGLALTCSGLALVTIYYLTTLCGPKNIGQDRLQLSRKLDDPETVNRSVEVSKHCSMVNNEPVASKQASQMINETELLYLVGNGDKILSNTGCELVDRTHPHTVYHNTVISSAQTCPSSALDELEDNEQTHLGSYLHPIDPFNVLIIDPSARHIEQPAILLLNQCSPSFMDRCHSSASEQTIRGALGDVTQLEVSSNSSSGTSRCECKMQSSCQLVKLSSPTSATNLELNSQGELTITDESSSFVHDQHSTPIEEPNLVRSCLKIAERTACQSSRYLPTDRCTLGYAHMMPAQFRLADRGSNRPDIITTHHWSIDRSDSNGSRRKPQNEHVRFLDQST